MFRWDSIARCVLLAAACLLPTASFAQSKPVQSKSSTSSEVAGSSVKTYELKNISPDKLGHVQKVLAKHAPTAELRIDQQHQRATLKASPKVQQWVAAQLRVSSKSQNTSTSEPRTIAYSVHPLGREIELDLRRRLSRLADVSSSLDRRTGRLLVKAPTNVHQQIQRFLEAKQSELTTAQESGRIRRVVGQETDEPNTIQTTLPAAIEMGSASTTLRFVKWKDLLASLQQLYPEQLVVRPGINDLQRIVKLPSPSGESTDLTFDASDASVIVRGQLKRAEAWTKVVRTLDDRTPSGQELKLLKLDRAKKHTVTRAIALFQTEPTNHKNNSPRPIALAQAVNQNPAPFAAQNPQQPGDQPPNQPQPGDNQPPAEANQPGAQGQLPNVIGVEDESFIGQPRIDFVEGLNVIIIRGRRRDVQRVRELIADIEKISARTEPLIEVLELEHVESESMAELINQINAQPLAARRGLVSVTALVKPNALLLIGREDNVKSTVDLIKRLDKPVMPSSQFQVFRLKNIPAEDAQTTIETFFSERGGLGTRVRALADYRSNSLIVYASPRDMSEVEYLIERTDVADSQAVDEVKVFKLKNALADELAPVLEAILRGESATTAPGGTAQGGQGNQNAPLRSSMLTLEQTLGDDEKKLLKSGILTDVRVSADTRANSLVVAAPATSMKLIAELIRQLDALPSAEAKVKIFPLENGDATQLVELLNELFGEDNQGDGPLTSGPGGGESTLVPLRFSVDPRSNSIVATGSEEDLEVVYAIVLRLDQSDASQRESRVYRLLNAPAFDVAEAVNEFLRSERDIEQIDPEGVSPFEQIEREVVVVAEEVSNSLIISATPRYFEQIQKIVEELDRRPPMVLISVVIAAVELDDLQEFGVELGLQDSLLFDRGVAGGVADPGFDFNNQPLGNANIAQGVRESVAGQALSNLALGRTNTELGYGGLVLSASSESVSILMRALQQQGRVDIISRPQVMTMNNQPARVQLGQTVPIITSVSFTNFGAVNNTEPEDIGILLGVTPRISPDGTVVMEVDAERSRLSEQPGIPISIQNGEVIRSPIIDRIEASTTVSAQSGQTIILGGLITEDSNITERRVPYLSDVPLLGHMFRFDTREKTRTELLFIMTPHVVENEEEARRVSEMEAQRMSWCLADIIEVHADPNSSVGLFGGEELPYEGQEIIISESGEAESPGKIDRMVPAEGPELPINPEPNVAPVPGLFQGTMDFDGEDGDGNLRPGYEQAPTVEEAAEDGASILLAPKQALRRLLRRDKVSAAAKPTSTTTPSWPPVARAVTPAVVQQVDFEPNSVQQTRFERPVNAQPARSTAVKRLPTTK